MAQIYKWVLYSERLLTIQIQHSWKFTDALRCAVGQENSAILILCYIRKSWDRSADLLHSWVSSAVIRETGTGAADAGIESLPIAEDFGNS